MIAGIFSFLMWAAIGIVGLIFAGNVIFAFVEVWPDLRKQNPLLARVILTILLVGAIFGFLIGGAYLSHGRHQASDSDSQRLEDAAR